MESLSFNPLFSGLTLKVWWRERSWPRMTSFNPLFSGLTLKVLKHAETGETLKFQSPIFGADAQRRRRCVAERWHGNVSIPYFRG